jgi:hypothetical protein
MEGVKDVFGMPLELYDGAIMFCSFGDVWLKRCSLLEK